MEESSRGKLRLDIKTRLQKQRPKNFKGHSIGCSDVIVITDDGKTTAYYVNKDGFIIVSDFSQSKVPPIPDFPLIRPDMKSKERKEHGLPRIIF